MRELTLALGMMLLLAAGHAEAASCQPDPAAAQALAQMVNTSRQQGGLRPLRYDATLAQVATRHACDMATRGYFDHVSPEGSTPKTRVKRAGYRACGTAENLAYGRDVGSTHTGLLQSPGHRANILRRTVDSLGVGVINGPRGPIYVEVFAQGC